LVSATLSGGSLTAAQQAAVATSLSLTETDSTGTGHGFVAWSYSVTDGSLDFLSQGQTLTLTYNVTVTDNHGLSVTQLVTITMTGTNDVPVIGGAATGNVIEDVAVDGSGNLTTSGVLTIADADQGQSNFTAQPSAAGTYGTFTLDAAGN
jgi:VCBS repeat-containing protein